MQDLPAQNYLRQVFPGTIQGLNIKQCWANHEYLEFAGKGWKSLQTGIVNEKGETFEEFNRRIRHEFRAADEVHEDVNS